MMQAVSGSVLALHFQDVAEVEGPVVEKIMGLRTSKKTVRYTLVTHRHQHSTQR